MLSDIGFDDSRVLTELKRITPYYSFGNSIVIEKQEKINIYHKIDSIWKQMSQNVVETCLNYLHARYGNLLDLDWIKFLIFPTIYKNDVVLGFYNRDNIVVSYRAITSLSKFRYIIPSQQEVYYYFQPLPSLINKQDIVITEGPFDVISFYLFNGYYNEENTFFISALGKKYVSCIKWLLLNSCLMYQQDIINIILVLDQDVINWRRYYYSVIRLLGVANLNNINIIILKARFDDVDKLCSYEVLKHD